MLKLLSKVFSQKIKIGLKPSQWGLNLRKFTTIDNEELCPNRPPPRTCPVDEPLPRGLVLGVYYDHDHKDTAVKFTKSAYKYNQFVDQRLEKAMFLAPLPKKGETRVYYGLDNDIQIVALVGLGSVASGYRASENRDEFKENVRVASAAGTRVLQDLGAQSIFTESFGHTESAAEGAALGTWLYQDKKRKQDKKIIPAVELYDDCDYAGWQVGLQKAAAQNLARQLTDWPANELTPSVFAQTALETLVKVGVNVEAKTEVWCAANNMNGYLAAAKGSCSQPIFLEIAYYGAKKDDRPIVLIGQGTTYNSGGLAKLSCKQQQHMRGCMVGAANVVAVTRAVAQLGLPINIRGLIPLFENMPGCSAMKPGDVYHLLNGKTVLVDSTNHAAQLSLADTLAYSQTFWPRCIVEMANMSQEIRDTLGHTAEAVFTNSESLWNFMKSASVHTGERMWRFPLWNHYKQLLNSKTSDTRTGDVRSSVLCNGAAFMHEFLPCGEWMHIESSGTMHTNGKDDQYLRSGMTGRPTRTLIEFIAQMVCHNEDYRTLKRQSVFSKRSKF